MPATPFQIKICGITRAEDLVDAVVAGADAVGLNFYPQSKRYVQDLRTPPMDERRFRLNRPVQVVGVFVNESLRGIEARCDQYALSAIQLHGDEPPDFLAKLPKLPVIRARRLDDRGPAAIADDLAACEAAGRLPDAVLVDALTPGQYGGTGETVSWAALADYHQHWQERGLEDVPLVLAGGLTPENVAEAIQTVRPSGVDVASGVEKSPGVKDPERVARFVAAAKSAFESL